MGSSPSEPSSESSENSPRSGSYGSLAVEEGRKCDTPYQDLKHPKGRDGKINTLGLEDKDVGSKPEITTKTWIKTGSRTIEQK
ncbi:unnamed protein product [Microthlaspi erraticum]|uniref:Uncharacterized protein n=1 Tax=Microthlaspi erraticum TaxID=1685480 RepID=A0A6D2KWP2_9BRAS|nr:unnamed protein product [Microthlaspi erraticum]CAA7056569.1 unnamed protein product [Microthlaspi erraticum]